MYPYGEEGCARNPRLIDRELEVKDELVAGFIRTSFGVKGEVRIESYSGEYEHLFRRKKLVVRMPGKSVEYEIVSNRMAHGHAIVKLLGIDTPEAAKVLRGAEIVVPRDDASALKNDEYYYADLMGLQVRTGSESRGTITAILENGSALLLEVTGQDETKHLVPFGSAFIGTVDIDSGYLEVVNPEVLE
ncbi:MAG: 16S rRNA processing protein RimM [Spirochaetales bacterium]|nr:MAG: 16S rRNA processing protein RimM [Spirochaetales bacterium]